VADGFGLREQLDARISTARRGLFYPALIRAIGPLALWLAAFAAFWLSGVHDLMPLEARAVSGLVFYAGLAVFIWFGLKRWRNPSDQNARDLIDDHIEGRPLSVWTDRPARADAATWKLWVAHRDRMAALAAKARKLDFRAYWRRVDPFHLRMIVPLLVIAVAVFANTSAPARLGAGLAPDFGALFGAHKLTVEAWITPPAYTGDAPFVLTSGEAAKAPQGSEVTLRVISPGKPTVRVIPDEGRRATLRPGAGVDGAYETRIIVDRPMRLVVDFWGARAAFPFTVIPDGLPKAEFVTPPKMGEGDKTEFEWKISDDYGVSKLELVARLASPPPGAPEVASRGGVPGDGSGGWEAQQEFVIIETIGLDPKEEAGAYSQDLVRHRWAGLDVMVKLRATDASGAQGESKEVAFKIPEKLFLQPIARSSQEIRATLLRDWRPYLPPSPEDNFSRVAGEGWSAYGDTEASRMRYAPEGVKMAALMIDALTYRPEDYFEDPVTFMGLRNARGLMDVARDKPEAEYAEDMLWNVALRAEYGSVADAKSALEAARRALEEALRNGASEEDIKRLMDMFEAAVENYLAAQMAEALREGRVSEGDGQQGAQGGGRPLGDDELQKMLDALRDLSETGASDQARQLLSDMSRMLEQMENMQLQMGQGGGGQPQDGPMSRALNRALQDTNRTLNDQRDLNDQTEQAMRNGGDAQRLADQQRALRERLEQQMRSGGGQPGEQPGQQGQQGQGQQGQQGEGQQGEGQQGQGEGQRGDGQQGQAQRPGQNGQQPGANGGGGRPGVDADGRYGEENARSRQLLGQALQAQRRAEDALRRGDFAGAQQAQREAMSSLAARSGELARLADAADPDAQKDRDERDVLGRLSNGDSGYGDNVKVPDEIERQKARDILNELRRRAGDRALRPEELEYLRRLLDRF